MTLDLACLTGIANMREPRMEHIETGFWRVGSWSSEVEVRESLSLENMTKGLVATSVLASRRINHPLFYWELGGREFAVRGSFDLCRESRLLLDLTFTLTVFAASLSISVSLNGTGKSGRQTCSRILNI